MEPISNHSLLVISDSKEHACQQVEDYFSTTLLIQYDKIAIDQSKCLSASDPGFGEMLKKLISENREILAKFVTEFKDSGFNRVEDLLDVECGYQSKLLHIITHFLDGFIGIDSKFYNLHEDSHWVSPALHREIQKKPESYWIIRVKGFSESPDKVALVQA